MQILAGTLGFAGHLVSPTVSEANVEGRPTINQFLTFLVLERRTFKLPSSASKHLVM